jgi:tetratricopeptide (TPR) repeat protein
MRALRHATPAADADPRALRRLLHAAVRERVGFEPTACAGTPAFARALRRVGVTDATAARAAALVDALDAAAFAGAGAERAVRQPPADGPAVGLGDLAAEARAVIREVDREAQPRAVLRVAEPPRGRGPTGRPPTGSAARGWLLVIALAGWGAAAACSAAGRRGGGDSRVAERAAAAFARGTAAYGRGDVRAARAAFLAAAAHAPAAPDAWANAGTAAWAAGDTVGAAVGWQRALRLEPTARDVRDRLALLPAAQDGWAAAVVPLHPNWPAYVALALALAAGAFALRGSLRGRPLRGASWPALWAAGLTAAAAGYALVRHADPAGRAVVAGSGPLRAEPSLIAEAAAPADPTDVARVIVGRGTWTRVALDGGREGWIESSRLVSLAFPAPAAPAGSRGGAD